MLKEGRTCTYKGIDLNSLVSVNREACDQIARLIATWAIPIDREESALPGFSKPLIGNFLIALVAICHQTSPRGRPPLEGTVNGKRLRGWDYLFGRLEGAARQDSGILTPKAWSTFSAGQVSEIFLDPELGERLTNHELRAALLRDLGAKMMSQDWEFADQMYEYCQGRVATGSPNLITTLSKFRAYDDPVRKKAFFFLALMRNSRIWHYSDDAMLGPPVDYHEVRGHLRLGTVEIVNQTLLHKIRTGLEVSIDEDVAIRRAVFEAIMHISDTSGLKNPSQLHYLFWNLFRSICTRDNPQCFVLDERCNLPDRYMKIVNGFGMHRCPFAAVCPSAGSSRPICEHVFDTDYY